MFSKIRRFTDSRIALYTLIGILSAVIFCVIFGTKVLNPTYTDWLLSESELSQHYLGWRGFRESSWQFPIGMLDVLAYPNTTSVIFTDSIPVFAVLFKLLSPVLPSDFQYFGLWGITCFVLQGIFAGRIIDRYSPNRIITVAASLLFPLAPIMINRMFWHTALAGQWIILFALDLVFNCEKYRSKKKTYLTITLLGVLAASIHIYFVLICGIVLVGYMIEEVLAYRNVKRAIAVLLDYLLSAAAVIYLLGGFSSHVEAQNTGLGSFSFNLNGFFNPQGWSCIFKDRALYGDGQYEGFGYLGAACIFAGVLAFICFIGNSKSLKYLKENWKKILALVFILLVSMVIAVSPVITLDDKVIREFTFPGVITSIWSVFRCTGRLIWAAHYVIMLVPLIVIIKTFNKKTACIICIFLTAFQFFDIHEIIRQRRVRFNTVSEYRSLLATEDFWDAVAADEDIEHVVYFTNTDIFMMYSLTDWAMDNGKTLNTFYFARSIGDSIIEARAQSFNELSGDTVFIFNDSERIFCTEYPLHYYSVDGLIVGFTDELSGFEEMDSSEFCC